MALSAKQEMFVKEYLIDLNGAAAAIRAGYSEKTARFQACNLLTKINIQEALKKAMSERSEKTGITAGRVLEEIGKIAFSKLGDYVEADANGIRIKDFADVDTSLLAEVSETQTQFGGQSKVKLHDKMKALELAARHLGMLTDNINQRGSINVIFPIPRPAKGAIVLDEEEME